MSKHEPMPTAPRKPTPWGDSMMTIRQRFGYFFIGAAFSSVLMGMYFFYVAKVRKEARQEQEARQAGQPLPVPGVPLRPTEPSVR